MQKSSLFTTLLLGSLLLAACHSGNPPTTATSDKPRVALLLSTMQEERYAKDQKYFEDKAKELGADVLFASANNDDKTQLAKVENLLAQHVKVLVIQPVNSASSSNFVKLAHDEGVKVVAYDRLINNAPVDLYVAHDSYHVGVLQAEAAAQKLNGKGNVVILMGQAGHSVANEITRGVEDTLKKYPGMKIVAKQSHDAWSPDLAMKTVENALTRNNNHIDAILANNSGMANGAVQALAEQKLLGKVFVAGVDADLTAIRNIVQGKQQFEVLKEIRPLAEAAAESAVKLAHGETPKVDASLDGGSGFKVPTVNVPVFPITKDTVDERIIKTGFHTRESVYGGG